MSQIVLCPSTRFHWTLILKWNINCNIILIHKTLKKRIQFRKEVLIIKFDGQNDPPRKKKQNKEEFTRLKIL